MTDTGVIILGNSFRIEPEKLMKCPSCGQTATKKTDGCYCPHCRQWKNGEEYQRNYPAIIDQLEDYLEKKYDVAVYSFTFDWFGVSCTGCLYDVHNGIIFHESNLPYDRRTVGLAHEAGHAIDFHKNYQSDLDRWNRSARFQLEQTAWEYAEEILKQFSFANWEYFSQHKSEGLKSYEEEKS